MPLFNRNVDDISIPNKHIVILQPITNKDVDPRYSEDVSIVRYVLNMFRFEDNSLRPRRINKASWTEPQTKQSNHFRSDGFNLNVETPLSTPMENKSNSISKKNAWRSIYNNLEDYFFNSSLHGLRYVGDTSISFGERLFWLCAFFSAVCFAAYFINSLYSKYNENPVIMSLNPTSIPLGALPFPAITICSMNQAKKSEAEFILHSGTEVEKMLLDDYCNLNNSYYNTTTTSDEATKWENVQKFILRVNPSCQEMLRVCFWKQQEMQCETLFNSDLTDEGLCCTFNSLPRSIIFRNPRDMTTLNLTFPSEVDDWNPEKGYSKNATMNSIPWRIPGTGTEMGLTVVLDAQINSYYCSSAVSTGFKVLIHNPLETPKMADFALLIPPGLEARIIIAPKIFDASLTIRDIALEKRNCYFTNERHLQFYRSYSELNCKLECQANYTLAICGCVPFYLPKDKTKKICSKKEEACSDAAKETVEVPTQNWTGCNCLPACFELGFDGTATYGRLSDKFKIREEIIKNESSEYFVSNMAVMHFYFVESQFTPFTKSELYGFSEFLSNTGGLLGLFMGFSFLSAVEVVYYLSLRIFCRVIRSTHQNQKKGLFKNEAAFVRPYYK